MRCTQMNALYILNHTARDSEVNILLQINHKSPKMASVDKSSAGLQAKRKLVV